MPWAIHANSKTTASKQILRYASWYLVADDRLELSTLGYEPSVLPLHQSAINFYTSKNYFGDPDRIRTCDLRFRKPLLYPTKLQDRIR